MDHLFSTSNTDKPLNHTYPWLELRPKKLTAGTADTPVHFYGDLDMKGNRILNANLSPVMTEIFGVFDFEGTIDNNNIGLDGFLHFSTEILSNQTILKFSKKTKAGKTINNLTYWSNERIKLFDITHMVTYFCKLGNVQVYPTYYETSLIVEKTIGQSASLDITQIDIELYLLSDPQAPINTPHSIGEHTDSLVTNPMIGQVVVFNGANKFVNKHISANHEPFTFISNPIVIQGGVFPYLQVLDGQFTLTTLASPHNPVLVPINATLIIIHFNNARGNTLYWVDRLRYLRSIKSRVRIQCIDSSAQYIEFNVLTFVEDIAHNQFVVGLTNVTSSYADNFVNGTAFNIFPIYASKLLDLIDVGDDTPVSGNTLKFNGSIWKPEPYALSSLNDTVIDNPPTEGQIIKYITGKWRNTSNISIPAPAYANLSLAYEVVREVTLANRIFGVTNTASPIDCKLVYAGTNDITIEKDYSFAGYNMVCGADCFKVTRAGVYMFTAKFRMFYSATLLTPPDGATVLLYPISSDSLGSYSDVSQSVHAVQGEIQFISLSIIANLTANSRIGIAYESSDIGFITLRSVSANIHSINVP